MANKQYKCLNFAACDKALQREVIEIEDGEDLVCPECESKLQPIQKDAPPLSKWLIPAVILLCVAGLAIWLFMPSSKPKTAAPISPNKVTATSPTAPQSTVPQPPPQPPQADACTDGQLAKTIQDRLAHDEDLKGNAIQVDVANKTVILSGTVENDLARNYAADLVHRSNCPIASVVNDIKLGQPDKAITDHIRQSYAKDSSLKSQPVQVEVSHGNVVLSGYVTDPIARTVAADDASHVTGVVTVTNNLLVHAAPPTTPQGHQSRAPQLAATSTSPNLSGVWTGTFQSCAQGQSGIRIQITDAAPDDITASVEITMPNGGPGTFTTHGVLNTMNGFLALQFSGWQHQPPGLAMGNIGGYVTYVNQKPDSISGVIKSPGCGEISVRKQ